MGPDGEDCGKRGLKESLTQYRLVGVGGALYHIGSPARWVEIICCCTLSCNQSVQSKTTFP